MSIGSAPGVILRVPVTVKDSFSGSLPNGRSSSSTDRFTGFPITGTVSSTLIVNVDADVFRHTSFVP